MARHDNTLAAAAAALAVPLHLALGIRSTPKETQTLKRRGKTHSTKTAQREIKSTLEAIEKQTSRRGFHSWMYARSRGSAVYRAMAPWCACSTSPVGQFFQQIHVFDPKEGIYRNLRV